jgi:hypothetical protein
VNVLSDIDSIESQHLKRLSKLNLIYFVVPFLSATYDYFYLSATEMIGGFIFFMGTFILIFYLKSLNPKIRWVTIVWLFLVLLTVLFIAAENFAGNVEDVSSTQGQIIGFIAIIVGIYYLYGLYTLLMDNNSISLFKTNEN